MLPEDSRRLEALTNALNSLLQKQRLLERRVTQLESLLPTQTPPSKTVEAGLVTSQTTSPPDITPTAEAEPAASALFEVPSPATHPALESRVGLTVVNRIGVLTLVLGVGFFFKWAVDNNWIGPAGRVILGIVAGLATLVAGDVLWRKGQKIFAQGITATGIAILYLAFYAAFDFYHLIPQLAAFALMVAVTAMTAVLALRYDSAAIAALSLLGGYITPLLLSTGQDHPWFLFSYLFLLNFAASLLARQGGWPKLEWISFAATVVIYGAWLLDRGTQPEKKLVATLAPLAFTLQRSLTALPLLFVLSEVLTALALGLIWTPVDAMTLVLSLLIALAGLLFAEVRKFEWAALSGFLAFWLIYLVHFFTAAQPVREFVFLSCGFVLFTAWNARQAFVLRQFFSPITLLVFSLNGVIYYAGSYNLLHAQNHAWLGPLAALVAGIYLAFAWRLRREKQAEEPTQRALLFSLGMALAFLTLAIPVQFTGFTITIAWAIQAAAVAWIGYRIPSRRAVYAAMAVFALVALRLVLLDSESMPNADSYSLLRNTRFLTFAISAAAMLLAAYWGAVLAPRTSLVAYFGGHIFLLWGLCLEIFGWAARSVEAVNRVSSETVAISILFAMYALVLVSAGVATNSTINRLSGLGLIGIVVVKLYFFDVWQLGRPYQIAAFVVLGILLLAMSFLYSHFRRVIESWWKHDKAAG